MEFWLVWCANSNPNMPSHWLFSTKIAAEQHCLLMETECPYLTMYVQYFSPAAVEGKRLSYSRKRHQITEPPPFPT
jgi:hypothetical protein